MTESGAQTLRDRKSEIVKATRNKELARSETVKEVRKKIRCHIKINVYNIQ